MGWASTGFEPMTSAMPVQCWCNAGAMLYQLSYEATQLGAGQPIGPIHFRAKDSRNERNVYFSTRLEIQNNYQIILFTPSLRNSDTSDARFKVRCSA